MTVKPEVAALWVRGFIGDGELFQRGVILTGQPYAVWCYHLAGGASAVRKMLREARPFISDPDCQAYIWRARTLRVWNWSRHWGAVSMNYDDLGTRFIGSNFVCEKFVDLVTRCH